MPRAYVDGCTPEAQCLEHFLLYLGFEVTSDPSRPSPVWVLTGPCGECPPPGVVAVVSADRAERCGDPFRGLAAQLRGPVTVRVEKGSGSIVYRDAGSLFIVMRELERLLEWRRLLWRQPPEEPYLEEAKRLLTGGQGAPRGRAGGSTR